MARPHRCLVVTVDGIPVARVSVERAIVLMYQHKAYMIHQQEGAFYNSKYEKWPVPAIIGLTEKHYLPEHYYEAARLSVAYLFRRDKWTCQYCGRRKGRLNREEKNSRGQVVVHAEYLTRDHVMPTSRGGEDKWENVVLACNTCNNRKSDRTPEEAGMPVLKIPGAPTLWELNQNFMEALARSDTASEDLKELMEDMNGELDLTEGSI